MPNYLLAMSAGDVLTVFNSLFFVLGGVTVFMIGMNMMGHNIEKAAGQSIRKLMGKATVNRFAGVGTGAAVTALVNSSSATTVMIVGFVNVGLMTLTQAASVIMGANIGTTVSAFIMALSTTDGAQLSIAGIFALVSFIGLVLTIACKSERLKQTGWILEGLGLIFIGLNVMSGAVSDLVNSERGDVSQSRQRKGYAYLGSNRSVSARCAAYCGNAVVGRVDRDSNIACKLQSHFIADGNVYNFGNERGHLLYVSSLVNGGNCKRKARGCNSSFV